MTVYIVIHIYLLICLSIDLLFTLSLSPPLSLCASRPTFDSLRRGIVGGRSEPRPTWKITWSLGGIQMEPFMANHHVECRQEL